MLGWLGYLITFIIFYIAIRFIAKDMLIFSYSILGGILYTIIGIIESAFVSFMVIIALSFFHPYTPLVCTNEVSHEIYSVATDDKISGSFVIGCGYVEEEMVYKFFVKENDTFKYMTINADKTIIKECNETPHVVERNRFKYDGEPNRLMKCLWGDNDEIWRICNMGGTRKENIIYVPYGTVVQNFEIKL